MTPRSGLESLIKEMTTSAANQSVTFSNIWTITKKPGDLKKSKSELQKSCL